MVFLNFIVMPETAIVTSTSMVGTPARLRARYKTRPGSKMVYFEKGSEILVAVPTIGTLFGIDGEDGRALKEADRELNVERRREGGVP